MSQIKPAWGARGVPIQRRLGGRVPALHAGYWRSSTTA